MTVDVDSVSKSYVLFGGVAGKEIIGPVGPFGPSGSQYVLCIPGLGYITLEDKGNSVRGPGDWSVQVSGSSTNWFYGGGGQAYISIVAATGTYTITGGSNSISGQM